MPSTGALVNANAGRARRDPALGGRLRTMLGDERVRLTRKAEDVGPALDALREAGVERLMLVGGDGTVGGTLTELLDRWPESSLPSVLVTAGGTVNTIAKSLGCGGPPEAVLARILERGPRELSPRPLVAISTPDGVRRSGMIFANGVAVRWLRMYYEDSSRGFAGASSVVARILGSALVRGALARKVFAPAAARVEVDGALLALERFTVMAASSCVHIGLGFAPFHLAGRDPHRFHFAVTEANAARIAAELPALRLGVKQPGSCIQDHAASRVVLRFPEPQPWSIDADLYPPAEELALEATAPVRFLLP
ncbi:MAG: diacylglycerol kinase family protein [Myxococcota bacterium]